MQQRSPNLLLPARHDMGQSTFAVLCASKEHEGESWRLQTLETWIMCSHPALGTHLGAISTRGGSVNFQAEENNVRHSLLLTAISPADFPQSCFDDGPLPLVSFTLESAVS